MVVKESTLKWIMRFYPPLFFQRIWVVKFEPGFMGVHVRVKKSFFNRNYNKAIFGGTLFSAADPFYPVLFHQALSARGQRVIVWLKSCTIEYKKPVRQAMHFSIYLSESDIEEASVTITTAGKFVKAYPVEMFNADGKTCALLTCEIYIRDLDYTDEHTKNRTPLN